MKNAISSTSTSFLSIPEVAWILGVDNSRVCRAIRVGLLPAVRRRGRVLVPARALAHLTEGGLCTEPPARSIGRGDA